MAAQWLAWSQDLPFSFLEIATSTQCKATDFAFTLAFQGLARIIHESILVSHNTNKDRDLWRSGPEHRAN
jgi:hypothetical protein